MQTKIEISDEAVDAALAAFDAEMDKVPGKSPSEAERRTVMRAALNAAASIRQDVTVPMDEFIKAPGDSVTKALADDAAAS